MAGRSTASLDSTMNQRVGAVSILWAIAGVWLIARVVHGLAIEREFESVVTSWLMTLVFGLLANVFTAVFVSRTLFELELSARRQPSSPRIALLCNLYL